MTAGLALATVGVGILCFLFAMDLGTWRLLGKIAKRPIDDTTEGLVSVVGRVTKRGKTLRGPISGLDCVYFDLAIEDPWRRRKQVSEILDQFYDSERVPFGLQGSAQRFAVEPAGAKFLVDIRREETVKSSPEIRQRLDARYGHVEKWRQYVESSIAVGDEVSIVGHATRSGDRTVIRKAPGHPFLIADRKPFVLRRRYAWRALFWASLAIGLSWWLISSLFGAA